MHNTTLDRESSLVPSLIAGSGVHNTQVPGVANDEQEAYEDVSWLVLPKFEGLFLPSHKIYPVVDHLPQCSLSC